MIVRGREFDEIYDLVGIRVLVELGARLLRGARRDPRAVDPDPRPLQGLHRHAEVQPLPVAAHHGDRPAGPRRSRSRSAPQRDAPARRVRRRGALEVQGAHERRQGSQQRARRDDTDMAWLAHISDWQAETADPGEFLDSLRFEIGAKEVYVFTPKGRVIGLPAGATPVDFAYAVHTEVGPPHDGRQGQRPAGAAGERALAAATSSRCSPRRTRMPAPARTGSSFVKSPRARNKIRQWFTKERREEAIEQGKDAIARAMRKQNLPLQRLMSQDSFAEVAAQSCGTRTSRRCTRRSAKATCRRSRCIEKVLAALHSQARERQTPNCSIPDQGPGPAAAQQRLRGARARRARHPRQAREVLHAGAGRRDRRLRHPRLAASRCTRRTATT